ncbi:MAG: phosphoglucosamine mutase, partial [Legionellales bacterium]
VVGTLMSNYGLELAIAALGIPFIRSKVGDRYVLEALGENDWKLGGEASGHILCLDKTTTGDGIVAALQVLAIMVKQDISLQQLAKEVVLLPQSLVNIKTEQAAILSANTKVIKAVQVLQDSLKGKGRVVLRPSGTEPLLRVMVEGLDEITVKQQAQHLCDEISRIDLEIKKAKTSA